MRISKGFRGCGDSFSRRRMLAIINNINIINGLDKEHICKVYFTWEGESKELSPSPHFVSPVADYVGQADLRHRMTRKKLISKLTILKSGSYNLKS